MLPVSFLTPRGLMIRDDIKTALVGAMKGGDTATRDTIRLIQSALEAHGLSLG